MVKSPTPRAPAAPLPGALAALAALPDVSTGRRRGVYTWPQVRAARLAALRELAWTSHYLSARAVQELVPCSAQTLAKWLLRYELGCARCPVYRGIPVGQRRVYSPRDVEALRVGIQRTRRGTNGQHGIPRRTLTHGQS